MVSKRYELRQATVSYLKQYEVYCKVMQELPVDVTLLGELQYDTFRFPSHGGLHWHRADIVFPQVKLAVMVRNLLTRFSQASADVFSEEYEVSKVVAKANGYKYLAVVIDDLDYKEQLARFIDISEINFVLFNELSETVKQLEEATP